MNHLQEIFQQCRQEKRAACIFFVSLGYPTLEDSRKAVEAAIQNGADIIELGVPFSDPMADGPVICKASRTAI